MSIAQMLPAEIVPQGVDLEAIECGLKKRATAEQLDWFKRQLAQYVQAQTQAQATARQREIEKAAVEHAASERLRLGGSLSEYCKSAWAFLEPGKELLWSWHYDLICEYLTLVKQKKLRRLIINVPPRTAKSTFATKSFPTWVWADDPSTSFMFASYSKDLSTDHSVHRRNLITSNWYQSLWSDKFKLLGDRNLTTQFTNDKMGSMISTSTGSGAEGKGCDIAILDDPMSSDQALSEAERTTSNRWFQNTLKQRLNNPATAAIIVIMQRLHELDTTGFVESEEPGSWKKIEIPLVAEKDETWVFPISGRIVKRSRGDVLQPERFTPEVVKEKQKARLTFAGQYQQHPAPLEGNLIKRSEVKYYGGRDPVSLEPDEKLPETFDLVLITADCSFKDLKTSDYVAIGTVGVKGRKRFQLKVVNAHLDCDGTEGEIKRQIVEATALGRRVSAVLVEDKANGSAVISRLKKNISGVIAVEPEGGKIARFVAACPEWQAGDWYVDRTAAWTEPYVQQLTIFPMGTNDDMCDMMSQASIWLQKNTHVLGLLDFYRSGDAKKMAEAKPENGANGHVKEAEETPNCASCGSSLVVKIAGGQMRCQQCGHQFREAKVMAGPQNRAQYIQENSMRFPR